MKHAPRLRLEPRPSGIACVAIACCCTATAILVACLPLSLWSEVLGVVAVAGVAVHAFWRCTGRGVPAFVHVGDDRRLTVSWRDGTSCDGEILADSYVGAGLTTMVWRPDHAPWWHRARTILILPDALPAEDFRRLRVLLRYGVPETRGDTNGVDAA
jgi:hypothetical protein